MLTFCPSTQYKRLHRLGREYPDPNYHFLDKLRNASRRNAHLTEDAEVKKWLDLGEFIYKGECAELTRFEGTTPTLTLVLSLSHRRG